MRKGLLQQSMSRWDTQLGNSTVGLLLAVAGLVVLGGVIWWGFLQDEPYGSEPEPAAEVVAPVAVEPAPTPEPEPIVPAQPLAIEPEPTPEPMPEPEPEPALPEITLAEADTLLSGDMGGLNGGMLAAQFVAGPNILERAVAVIDNLRQGSVPYKLLPVGRPEKPFAFTDNGLAVTIDPAGFERYDGLASAIAKIDVAEAVTLYQRYQGAAEEAWAMLGYTDIALDEALINALGLVLTAPETDLNARLLKKEANWIYEDEALEALPAIHKQMMRMGPNNAQVIQDKARELRGALMDLAAQ